MSDLATGLTQLIADPSRVLTQPQIVERLSRDFYWYSPILKPLLDGKHADVVVQPLTVDEIVATLRFRSACVALLGGLQLLGTHSLLRHRSELR